MTVILSIILAVALGVAVTLIGRRLEKGNLGECEDE